MFGFVWGIGSRMVKKEKKPGAAPAVPNSSPLNVDECDEKIAVLRRGTPPPAVSYEEFRDRFKLNGSGMNPHRRAETENVILQSDLTKVFGAQKGKSGFLFADVKDPKIKSAIARLYPIVYQKPYVVKTKLIGKEFAIGIVAEVVKGLDVDWASYAHDTNRNQRSSWQKKMRGQLEMKAALTKRDFTELLEEEDLTTLMQGESVVKAEPGGRSCGGVGSRKPGQSSSWIEQKKRESHDL